MASNHDDQSSIRGYLLNQLPDDRQQQIEQRLLTDDELFDQLQAAEEELIDQYLLGELSKDEAEMFEKHFLATAERQQKLRFAKAFRRYVANHASEQPQKTSDQAPASWAWRNFISASPLRAAAFAALILVAALGVWRIFFYQSDVDKGLIALNAAYREQRPIESRISRLNYAPFATTRGGAERIDSLARNRAEAILSTAVIERRSPAAHQALGEVYLTKKQFDDAIREFEEGLKADPLNPQLLSDLGAAWLEKGRIDLDKGKADPTSLDSGKGMEELGRSLENLNKALEVNPNLLEALFNRALCERHLTLYAKAEDDWRQYLQKDPTSQWADEARRNLKALEDRKNKAAQSQNQLQRDFLDAFNNKDDEKAWAALSHSRARTGNRIVEELLDDFINLSMNGQTGDAHRTLRLIVYAGDVETKKTGDRYTSDLATIYSDGGLRQLRSLAAARIEMKLGSASFSKNEFDEAIRLFTLAEESFSTLGDIPEALFARSWLGYSSVRIPKPESSIRIFEELSSKFDQRDYKFFQALTLNALGDAQSSLNEFSKTLDYANRGFVVSEKVQDNSNAIRCLTQRVSMRLILNDEKKSLDSFLRAAELADTIPPEPRLLWPLYYEAALDFHFLHLPASALAFAQESMRLALLTNAPLLRSRSFERIGVLQSQQGDLAAAVESGEHALAEARNISGELTRRSVTAHAMVVLAELFAAANDFRKSIEYFDGALSLFQELKLDVFAYRAHKGKLLVHLALHDDAAAGVELNTVVQLFEDQRKKIIEESNRDKFFDSGQDTYDLAIDFASSKRKDYQQAFEYAEASRARSLFEMMNSRPLPRVSYGDQELELKSETVPLHLSEIQNRMPEDVQLLEYAVLHDKILMWVVTRSSIRSGQTNVAAQDLDQRVHRFVELLSRPVIAATTLEEIRSEGKGFYNVLIEPIEQFLNKDLQLCIVPDKGLNYLPFAALLSSSGKNLIEDYRVEESPSAAVFIRCSENGSQRARMEPETLLSVGNPEFSRSQFSELPDLPGAAREATEIGSLYKASTILTGAMASPNHVAKALATANVIHFATHVVADEDSPLASKLILANNDFKRDQRIEADGTFEAFDIYGLPFPRSRLVVLSACQSGIERAYKGEGAVGLARPFIAAGVPLVIASLWSVESNSTADLMISFHRYRKVNQLPTVSSLRSAQLDMIHKQQPDETSYGWAAFIVIGGQAAF